MTIYFFNHPNRQLMAEARAEVLEEIIKNQNGPSITPSSSPQSLTRSDSLDPVSDLDDELTTFEKGVQKKFNSVSSSVNSFSSGGEICNGDTDNVKNNIRPGIHISVEKTIEINEVTKVEKEQRKEDKEENVKNKEPDVPGVVSIKSHKLEEIEKGSIEVIGKVSIFFTFTYKLLLVVANLRVVH
jgi:hypothetical protein